MINRTISTKWKVIVYLFQVMVIVGLYDISISAQAESLSKQIVPSLPSAVKHRADQLISVFENSTPILQYSYVIALGDGRGYTVGRAGFTTATGDALLVVAAYTDIVPNNGLKSYLAELRRLARLESGAIGGLKGFPAAWKLAARDSRFRAVQDDVTERLYFQPAMQRAKVIGVKLNLTKVALYEAVIQHGDGDDPDGLLAIIRRATKQVGGTPHSGIAEKRWLRAFLGQRRADLLHPFNQDTAQEWRESVGRADEMLRIWTSGNFDFHGPLTVNPFGDQFTLP